MAHNRQVPADSPGNRAANEPLEINRSVRFLNSDPNRIFTETHEPRDAHTIVGNILLCQAIGEHYALHYHALRDVAGRLASAGYRVMRFDYQALGDSEGSAADCRLKHWQTDIQRCIDELQRTRQTLPLHTVAIGLSCPTLLSTQQQGIESCLLIDPVLSGRDFLTSLSERMRQQQKNRDHSLWCDRTTNMQEILGFRCNSAMIQDLMHLEFQTHAFNLPEQTRIVRLGCANQDTTGSGMDLDNNAFLAAMSTGLATPNHSLTANNIVKWQLNSAPGSDGCFQVMTDKICEYYGIQP